jgi:hypothetical protein
MNDAAVERKPDRTHEAWLGDEISDEALEPPRQAFSRPTAIGHAPMMTDRIGLSTSR